MIFSRIKGVHLNGKKQMSLSQRIEERLDPDFIYIPLQVGNIVYKRLVEIGDKVLMGQHVVIREGRFGHPVASSVSGEVTAIKKMWHSSGKMIDMLEIKNDYQETPCYGDPETLPLLKDEMIDIIKNAGIVGLGGAGFPTYVKYLPTGVADAVIINAAECEPYITGDYMSIITNASKVIGGLKIMMKANLAKKGFIAIKKNKFEAIQALKDVLQNDDNIEIFLLKDTYPAGWEKYIVEKILDKAYVTLPREAGAVVNNVQTAIAVYDAIYHNKPLIDRVVTISGEGIKQPKNFRVKIGTRISTLIENECGYIDDLDDAYFICGGPMTGRSILFDDLVITANVGSIVVLPKKNSLSTPNCMGCGKCAENCPAKLTPTSIKKAYANKNIAELALLNTASCVQCGLCSYVCPSRIEMTDFVGKAKEMLLKANDVKKK